MLKVKNIEESWKIERDITHALSEAKETYGWVQWKGTDVCIDFHCKCGAFTHIDSDFLYSVTCPECGKHYAMLAVIHTIELEDNPDV